MQLWERIKKIKNKFWIVVNILFIWLIIDSLYDMYYHFDMWGGDAFPLKHYQSKEAYATKSFIDIAFYSIIFVIGLLTQNKFPRISKFLLMVPLWALLIGFLFMVLSEIMNILG